MSRSRRTSCILSFLLLCATGLQLGGVAALAGVGTSHQGVTAGGDPSPNPHSTAPAASAPLPDAPAVTTPPTTTPPPPAPVPPVAAPPSTAPAPAPLPATAAPAPAPAPPAPQPAPLPPQQHLEAAFDAAVPAAWRADIPVTLELLSGSTSWGWPDGRIQVSNSHFTRSEGTLQTTLAHEFGHLIAYRYGAQNPYGAAPAGWPAYSSEPVEAWADCVAQVFTGVVEPSHGLPPCSGASLSFAASWLAQGPAAHPRTG